MEITVGEVWRAPLIPENIVTLAENKIAFFLATVNTPHNVDAATHARDVQWAEQYVAEFRETRLPLMLNLFTDVWPPGTSFLSTPVEEEGKTGKPASKRARTQA